MQDLFFMDEGRLAGYVVTSVSGELLFIIVDSYSGTFAVKDDTLMVKSSGELHMDWYRSISLDDVIDLTILDDTEV